MKRKLALLALTAVLTLGYPKPQNGNAEGFVPPATETVIESPATSGTAPAEPTVTVEEFQPKSIPAAKPAPVAAASSVGDHCGDATIFPRVFGGSDYKVFSGVIRDRIFTGDRTLRHPFGGRFARCR